MATPRQGDIIRINGIKCNVVVLSKDFFNKEGEIIACPAVESCVEGPLHIAFNSKNGVYYALCEKLIHLDIKARGYSYVDSLEMRDIMNIADAVQGLFDYV